MKITVVANPEFVVPLSKHIIQTLHSIGSTHSNRVCRDSARVGGFLFDWLIISRASDVDIIDIKATWQQLETIVRICELMIHLQDLSTEDKQELDKLNKLIYKAFQKANVEIPKIRMEITG